MPLPLHRSYSQVSQLRKCGEQFRLERIERVPSRPMVAAVGGKIVHSATEEVDRMMHVTGCFDEEQLVAEGLRAAEEVAPAMIEADSVNFPPEEWKRFGRRTVEKPNAEDIGWFRDVGIPNAVRAYVDWRLSHPLITLAEIPGFGPAIEVPFNLYLGGQLVHGFIDRVFLQSGEDPFPVDLKSGLCPATDEQLGTYAEALRRALGWEVKWGIYLYAMKTGTLKQKGPIDLSHWTGEKLDRIYVGSTAQLETGIFLPSPGEQCHRCSVSHACAFFQSAL